LQKGIQFASLTDIIYQSWSDKNEGIQKVQGHEKRKPARQHGQQGIGQQPVEKGIEYVVPPHIIW
jgi:hypothetical protein